MKKTSTVTRLLISSQFNKMLDILSILDHEKQFMDNMKTVSVFHECVKVSNVF